MLKRDPEARLYDLDTGDTGWYKKMMVRVGFLKGESFKLRSRERIR